MGSPWTSTVYGFAVGELDPALHWRRDLRVYYQSLRRLENAWPWGPTGTVRRRPGTRLVSEVAADTLTIWPFVFDDNERHFLVFRSDGHLDLHDEDGAYRATSGAAHWWSDTKRPRITQLGDTVLVFSPVGDPPKKLSRIGLYDWSITDFGFPRITTADGSRYAVPYVYHDSRTHELQPSATTGTITLTAYADDGTTPLFDASWVGEPILVQDREVVITAVTDGFTATAEVRETLPNTNRTRLWKQALWSPRNGWPTCGLFFAGRLWLAGGGLRPWTVAGSKVLDWWNFDPGTGKDDDAIVLEIAGDRVRPPVGLVGLGDLLVLTPDSVWAVLRNSDGAFTPTGSTPRRVWEQGVAEDVRPVHAMGGLLLCERRRRELWFVAQNEQGGYNLVRLSPLHDHLTHDVASMAPAVAGDLPAQTVLAARSDGQITCLRFDPGEQVMFACRWTSPLLFREVLPFDRETWFLAEAGSKKLLLKLDPDAYTDGEILWQGEGLLHAPEYADLQETLWARHGYDWSEAQPLVGGYAEFTYSCDAVGFRFDLVLETHDLDGAIASSPLGHRLKRVHMLHLPVEAAVELSVQDRTLRMVPSPATGVAQTETWNGMIRTPLRGVERDMTVPVSFTAPAPTLVRGYAIEAVVN